MSTNTPPDTPRLLDRVSERLRLLHRSRRTEQAYCDWIRRFVLFHGTRHPSETGREEVVAFLTSLAVEGNVSASTQNQRCLLRRTGRAADQWPDSQEGRT